MDGGGNSLAAAAAADGKKRRVCYYYDKDVGNFYYGHRHPMKPHRIRMTHALLDAYGLLRPEHGLTVLYPDRAQITDMRRFHADDYIDFLCRATPETADEEAAAVFNITDECPVFDDLFDFCSISAGGSLSGARKLNAGEYDIAINWAGGLHHAKQSRASGFCYVNDIVLAILELLEAHQRVLYVDIDVHHGDGVEEAFYTTDRVMTVSFHKFGDFFPGTGHIGDIGYGNGKYYSLNIPLEYGIDDESYHTLFKPIMTKVMEVYQPNVVVLQCGADSLSGDQLGCFNLSVKGHAECVRFMRSFNVPLLLLGGGGYTLRNVARCWCYETAVALNTEIENRIPENDYILYFSPEYALHAPPSNMENKNSCKILDDIKAEVLDNLSKLQHAPSVQFQERAPNKEDEEDEECQKDDEDKHVSDSAAERDGDDIPV